MTTTADAANVTESEDNLSTFTDCLSVVVAQKLGGGDASRGGGKKKRGGRGRKNEIKPVEVAPEEREPNDAAELGDFIEYLANEIFPSLPEPVRTLSYAAVQDDPSLASKYAVPSGLPLDPPVLEELTHALPASIADSLVSYLLIDDAADVPRFLEPVLSSYLSATTAPPAEYTPALTQSRPEGCEICDRAHLPLTYHHLIPRSMHAKAVKRGWHAEWELNKVAWLCRACHSYVHKVATNEELAREWFGVERLMEREDVRKWAAWVGKVRWKAR